MAANAMSGFIQHLRRTALPRDGAGLTDAQLLEDYVHRREQAALAALVRRHAGMVWGVCRRTLRNVEDAEDAFQATFLVLVRKAAGIVPREMVGNWLYGVAQRTALKARATAARRSARERQVADIPQPAAADRRGWHDLEPLLDEALGRLPERYRAVLVLCDLEGKARKEAARQLGCPEGTVAGRLARARLMLARRLTRRCLAVPPAAVAALLSQSAASAGAPAALTSSTIQAASRFAARQGAGAVSAKVVALSEGVLKTMLITKIKTVTILLAAVTLCGAAGLIYQTYAAEPAPVPVQARSAGKPPARNAAFIREEERLRGTWKLAEGAWGGKKGNVEEAEASAVLTIKGETLHFQFSEPGDGNPSPEDRFFVFKLDPTTTPKLIDLADWQKGFEDNPNIIEGIYALDGDTLTVCFTDGSFSENNRIKSRPTTFQTSEGSNTTVWILRRDKKRR